MQYNATCAPSNTCVGLELEKHTIHNYNRANPHAPNGLSPTIGHRNCDIQGRGPEMDANTHSSGVILHADLCGIRFSSFRFIPARLAAASVYTFLVTFTVPVGALQAPQAAAQQCICGAGRGCSIFLCKHASPYRTPQIPCMQVAINCKTRAQASCTQPITLQQQSAMPGAATIGVLSTGLIKVTHHPSCQCSNACQCCSSSTLSPAC